MIRENGGDDPYGIETRLYERITELSKKIEELKLLNDNLDEQLVLACDTITQQSYKIQELQESFT